MIEAYYYKALNLLCNETITEWGTATQDPLLALYPLYNALQEFMGNTCINMQHHITDYSAINHDYI